MSDQKFDKNSKKNVIQFALMLSIICSLLITGAASGLKSLQQENVKLDKIANILKAANLITGNHKPPKEVIQRLYRDHIREVIVDKSGQPTDIMTDDALHLYYYHNENAIDGYIIPINTKGLWGKIQGYLAFQNDGQTVSGFSVFSHAETPGLGGEIENAWFRKNFQGKKILNAQNQFVSVGIAKGKVKHLPKNLQDHYVDGISGATLTGQYLSEGIKSTLTKYEPVSVLFRQKSLKTIQ
ncbi:MAG: Na+-transporting NADH:ubiquinone oxidoreductase subunit C [Candidatus Magnetoglobus multicellularis str. Araruama]|uniref:Na(+)-translocating NADH-quinone reductase subunit C n=1 Tax=Candidatus Magnetoglobus multicellularis str. Araruama TaxID=890399 RepID=A0A1V1P5E1_9BACT|nr:MAG: Na+-transporting NADH:ubiquinone oxidoreductase subunit C [Candidatus Magnetoglobus multicellularis str. Araruama]